MAALKSLAAIMAIAVLTYVYGAIAAAVFQLTPVGTIVCFGLAYATVLVIAYRLQRRMG